MSLERIQSEADDLLAKIMAEQTSLNERLGLAILTATTFIAGGAAILEKLAAEKGGPELDQVGWAEEVTKIIIRECKAKLRS